MAKRNNMFKLTADEIQIKEGFNIRTDYGDIKLLAASIEAEGIKVPLIGHKENGKFIPTDGHRRFQAVQYLQSQDKCLDIEIPFCVQPKDYTDQQRTLDLLILNDGKKLTLLEEGLLFFRLKEDFELNNTEIGNKVGKSSMHVSNCLLLLEAPQELIEYIEQQQLSATTVIDQLRKDKDGQVTLDKIQQAIEDNEGKTITKKHIKEVESSGTEFESQEKTFSEKLAEANESVQDSDNTIYQTQPDDPTEEDNYQEITEPVNDSFLKSPRFKETGIDNTNLLKGLNLAISELINNEDMVSKAVVKTMEFVEALSTGDITPDEFCHRIQTQLV